MSSRRRGQKKANTSLRGRVLRSHLISDSWADIRDEPETSNGSHPIEDEGAASLRAVSLAVFYGGRGSGYIWADVGIYLCKFFFVSDFLGQY